MRPADRSKGDAGADRSPPLEYAPATARRGARYWASRFLTRLTRPMPLGMYYLITLVLGIVATLLAVLLAAIVRAVR